MFSKEIDTDDSQKCVYIIAYWDGEFTKNKIHKICDSFNGQRFDLPDPNEIGAQIQRVTQAIEDAQNIYQNTR